MRSTSTISRFLILNNSNNRCLDLSPSLPIYDSLLSLNPPLQHLRAENENFKAGCDISLLWSCSPNLSNFRQLKQSIIRTPLLDFKNMVRVERFIPTWNERLWCNVVA